jgi:pyruvate,water dikinase
MTNPLILWLDQVDRRDVGKVGGKNSSLGEMIQSLGTKGISVPGGFATTAYAYRMFLKGGLSEKLSEILDGLDSTNVNQLRIVGNQARAAVLSHPFSDELVSAITSAYAELSAKNQGGSRGTGVSVAVRSSATAEDLPTASFAGQQEYVFIT